MLVSRLRRTAILCRISIALIAVGAWPHGVAYGELESEYFWDGMQAEMANVLCGDQHFLDIAKLSAEVCKKAVAFHVEECRTIVEPLQTEMLVKVYLMCLQSKVLLSEAGDK